MEPTVSFEVVGRVTGVEQIAAGAGLRQLARLRREYGRVRWRKLKGFAIVRLPAGKICWAEVHWYEGHGVGRRELKIKRILRELR